MVDDILGELLEGFFDRDKKKKGRRGDDDYDDDDGYRGRGTDDRGRAPSKPAPPLFCQQCGTKNDPAARFCEECGEILPAPGVELKCHGCGKDIPVTAKFCANCGTKLAPGERGRA